MIVNNSSGWRPGGRLDGVHRPLSASWRSAVFVIALLVLPVGCSPSGDRAETQEETTARPQPGGTAVLCVPSAPSSLDPFVTNDQRSFDLASLLFTPLVRWSAGGDVQPYLARSWSWADDRRQLTLQLRTDVRWHDSSRVTAEDVAWTLEAASSPEYASPLLSDFRTVEEATAPDSTTVVVRFADPYHSGLEPLTSLPILPRHLLAETAPQEFAQASYHRNPVGSGPFRLSERRPSGSLVFERFGRFPDDLGSAYLDRIVVRVIESPRTMLTEFRVGGVDACVTTASGAAQLQEGQGLKITPLQPSGVQFVALNTGTELFGDSRVRRALSAGLDRAAIATVVSPAASPAGTPLPTGSPWTSPAVTQPDDDPALADSLLAAAGWTRNGEDGMRLNADGEPLTFTLASHPGLRDPLTAIQSQLEGVGVDVALRFMEPTAFIGTIRNPETRPAAMALGSQYESLKQPDLRPDLQSGSPRNLSGFASARLDTLMNVAVTARDSGQRHGAYREIQEILSEQVPVIYTVYVPRTLAVGPRLRGVEPALNTPLASVAEWWIPRARRR